MVLSTQLEREKKAADERVKRAEMKDATLEERAREHTAQLSEARDKESQHRATAAQMRFRVVFSLSLARHRHVLCLCVRAAQTRRELTKHLQAIV